MEGDWLQNAVLSDSKLFDDAEETVEESTEESIEEIENTEVEETEEAQEGVEGSEDTDEEEETEETEVETEDEEEKEETVTEYGSLLQDLVNDDTLFYDEEKDYEDSQEGVKELFQDNIERKSEEKLKEYKESLPEDGRELLDFIKDGGSVDKYLEFKNGIDYSAYSLEDEDGEDNIDIQKNFIYESLKKKGMDDDSISDVIESSESKGTLKSKAQKAKDELVKGQEDSRKEYLEKSKAEKEAEEKQAIEYAAEFKETVLNTEEIQGFKLSKTERAKLHDFITKPLDKEGNTGLKLKDTQENRLLYAYMAMKGFSKGDLAKEERKKATIKLKKKLTQSNDSRANLKNKTVKEKEETDEPSIGSIWNATKGF